jgi:hypothetical protein
MLVVAAPQIIEMVGATELAQQAIDFAQEATPGSPPDIPPATVGGIAGWLFANGEDLKGVASDGLGLANELGEYGRCARWRLLPKSMCANGICGLVQPRP